MYVLPTVRMFWCAYYIANICSQATGGRYANDPLPVKTFESWLHSHIGPAHAVGAAAINDRLMTFSQFPLPRTDHKTMSENHYQLEQHRKKTPHILPFQSPNFQTLLSAPYDRNQSSCSQMSKPKCVFFSRSCFTCYFSHRFLSLGSTVKEKQKATCFNFLYLFEWGKHCMTIWTGISGLIRLRWMNANCVSLLCYKCTVFPPAFSHAGLLVRMLLVLMHFHCHFRSYTDITLLAAVVDVDMIVW